MVTVALTQYLASGTVALRVDPLNILLGLAALMAVLTGLAAGYRRLGRKLDQFTLLFRDFYGDDRPGVPHKPGVLVSLDVLSTKLDKVLTEITPNHGSSMKDAVTRMDTRLEGVESDLTRVHERLDGGGKVEVNVHP